MSRDAGFAVADFATSHFDDLKVKAMWRALAPDADAMCRALTLHAATVLMSWREGRRVTAEDAAPAWLSEVEATTAHLVAHELLDGDGRVPRKSFNAWFGAAKRRRDANRKEWRDRQAKRRARTKSGDGVTGDTPPESPPPSVPTVPTVPTVRPSPARANGKPPDDERPFVTLSDEEKEAHRRRSEDEVRAKLAAQVGVKLPELEAVKS